MMIQAPDTTEIMTYLSVTFVSILTLTLIVCYYKKILNLIDYFSFDDVSFLFKSDLKDTNSDKSKDKNNFGNNKSDSIC